MIGDRLLRSGLVAVVGVATLLVGPTTAPVPSVEYTATGFSQEELRMIDWAVDLFVEAHLELPTLELVHHATAKPCRGARGYFTGDERSAHIDICMPDAGPQSEVVLLHELAHAWDAHMLTTERRTAFLQLRGLDQWWDDHSTHWGFYGAEQAAQMIMWGLIDRPIRVATIPHASCAALRTGYVLLTGQEPLHGYTDQCFA